MSLKARLVRNAILVVALVLGFVLVGTYWLFSRQVHRLFFESLNRTATTAAMYHLERDEFSEGRFRSVEQRYRRIYQASIRFFDEENRMVFEFDSLNYVIPLKEIELIRSKGESSFSLGERQFSGLYYRDNQGDFVVIASDVDKEGTDQLERLRWIFITFFFLGLIGTFFLSLLLAKETFNPFYRVMEEVNAITDRNLHKRISLPKGKENELYQLVLSLNRFLERIEIGIDAQRHFLKHASHELRTPLTAIIGSLEVTLAKERNVSEYEQEMRSIRSDAVHIMDVLQALLTISGLRDDGHELDMEWLRLDELVWDILDRRKLLQKSTAVNMDLSAIEKPEEQLTIKGNRDLLTIAIGNLIDNALKFSDEKPVVAQFLMKDGQLCLSIQDKGVGIAAEDSAYIFDLFYRGKRTIHVAGTGIGLHLSRIIFQRHGIAFEVLTELDVGTSFLLYFAK
ncbi:sensor histidine kinase [Olivibacter sitiensis]|uniref:sensor histidine kinase n=1 Tax=Olivibacter sitiensis TaxID=376470 RepID=UPI0003FF2E2F|nr:HAMP domain-containing sensor histidine kinase [Olivibacter sitiensis]